MYCPLNTVLFSPSQTCSTLLNLEGNRMSFKYVFRRVWPSTKSVHRNRDFFQLWLLYMILYLSNVIFMPSHFDFVHLKYPWKHLSSATATVPKSLRWHDASQSDVFGCSWRIFEIRLPLLFKGKWSRQQVCNYFSGFGKILFLYYLLHVLWRWKSFEVSFLAIINTLHFKPCCFTLEPYLHWTLIKTNCKNGNQAVVFCLLFAFSPIFTLVLTLSFHVTYIYQVN